MRTFNQYLVSEMPHGYFDNPVVCPNCKARIRGIDSRLERLPNDTEDKISINKIANRASMSEVNPRLGTHCKKCGISLVIINNKKAVYVIPSPIKAKKIIDRFNKLDKVNRQEFIDSLENDELGSIVSPVSLEDEQRKNSIIEP